MTLCVGLGVSEDVVRAVVVRDGRVIWGAESSVGSQPIDAAVAELLMAAPLRRWPRPRIVAAVGPARAQLRRIAGLPRVSDSKVLARMIGESAGRFFLRNGVPLVTTGVRRHGESEGWSAAIEQPVVAAVESGCRTRGLRLSAVVPTMAVLQHALQGEALDWWDGDICARLTLVGNRLNTLRRLNAVVASADVRDADPPRSVAPLRTLGAESWRFADAYGAAVTSATDDLVHRPARVPRARPVPAWRLWLAGAAIVLAFAAALVVPTLVSRRAVSRATAELSRLARQRGAAVAAEADLTHLSAALDEVASFGRERRSASRFLDALAHALPAGAALVTVRADSAGGLLVALTPRAALLIGKLEDVPNLSTPTIVGPVTREVAAGAEVERVTIRFRWADLPVPQSTRRRAP